MYQDEGFDPRDVRHVAIAERADRARLEQQRGDIKKILSMPEGRRLFWKYLSECGIYKSSMTGNNHTFFNEGKREIGLKLLNDMMDVLPDAFIMMQKEEAERSALEKNNLLKEIRDVSSSEQ